MKTITVNGKEYQFEAEDDMPLLWVLREKLGLQGTKFGCGAGMCGACSVHVDGNITRSCITQISTVLDSKITTIEGISDNGDHPVQKAWEELEVPQCGYCQSGQIMCAVALLDKKPSPSDKYIKRKMNVICRCGTHQRIKQGVKRASELMNN